MRHRPDSVIALRDLARERLREVLGPIRDVALVNFPNHGNPGDPAIWLGSEAILRELGVRVRYRASHWSFDASALRRALPTGAILINGGGNFGDLYAGQQTTREIVLREMHDYPIVQLPQSVHFRSSQRAASVADLIRAHGRVTLMVRDDQSLHYAEEILGVGAVESPDHVFGLGPLTSTTRIQHDITWLTWRPGATEWHPDSDPPVTAVNHVDWIEAAGSAHERFDRAGRVAWRINQAFLHRWETGGALVRRAHPLLGATFDPLARRWMTAGLDVLGSSRVVVTNKLHGHIMCTLLGTPHVVLDNSYGKVFGAVGRWTGDLPGVHVARNAQEAWSIAQELAAAPLTGTSHSPIGPVG